MGYGGACYMIQEVCNALFDALFNILPLGSDLDRAPATPTRERASIAWEVAAELELDKLVASEPILVRISAAKRLRDAAESAARNSGAEQVTVSHLQSARQVLTTGVVA